MTNDVNCEYSDEYHLVERALSRLSQVLSVSFSLSQGMKP